MCKEGIRIGRQTARNAVTQTFSANVLTSVFPPRPDRLALSLVFRNAFSTLTAGKIMLGVRVGDGFVSFAAVSDYDVSWFATVEQLGGLITGEVVVMSLASDKIGDVCEVFLDQSLSEV